MTIGMKNFGVGSLFLLLAACGSNNTGGTGSGDSNGPSTIPPQCVNLPSCSERCYCTLTTVDPSRTDAITVCATQYCSGDSTAMGGGGDTGTGGATSGTGTSTNPSGGGGSTSAGGASVGTGTGSGTSVGGTTGVGGNTGTGGTAVGTGGTTGAPATQTFTISSATFSVPAGQDVYKCQNFVNPLTQDVAILESESFMSPHSHHMFVFHNASYNSNTTLGDCPNGGNEFADFIHSAQTPQQSMTYPTDVGRILHQGEGLRILVHYYNPTDAAITGQVAVTFHYADTTAVKYLASEIFLNNTLVTVKPGTSDQSKTDTLPNWSIKLLSGVSHMHARGVGFTAKTSTGQVLYTGTDWNEPQSTVYPTGLDIAGGTQITWTCSYDNKTGTTMTFGEHAANNEMCIFSGVFYTTDMAHQGAALNDATGLGIGF